MILLKNHTEIEKMRKAGRISAEVLRLAGETIKPGITTKYLDTVIYDFITSKGAVPSFLNYNGFPGSACISVNDEVIHGIPSEKRVLEEGDIVSVDVGALYDGFHSDTAATFPCGKVSDEAMQLMQVTKKSLEKGIEQAVIGKRIGDISYAVQSYVESFGYGVVKEFTGHGVGKNLHEEPEVPNYGRPGRGPRLAAGMVIAIEPMINLKGAGIEVTPDGWTVLTKSGSVSAHFEHTVAITENGPIILTAE